MRRLFFLVILVLVGTNLTGCFLAPAISSMKEAGLTEADRMTRLSKDIKIFQDALYWGDQNTALAYVLPDNFESFQQTIRASKKNERIVESKVESANFTEDAYAATVEITVRSYRVPYYVVQDRLERQQWKFTLADGWKIASREVLPPVS